MYEIKDVAQDIKSAAKRRWVLLIITPILFVIAAITALYFIEPNYKSSTTILVQQDETLNPLVLYEIAVHIASEDRLQSLNEIIFSRSTMEVLIDSLQLERGIRTEAEKQQLIEKTQKNIETRSRASDSFEISFYDTNPVRARDGAELLANYFIRSKLRMETRRHEETVAFFTKKLEELEEIVGNQRDQSVTITSQRMRDLPSSADNLQDRLQIINTQLDAIEWQIVREEDKLAVITAYQNESNQTEAIMHLYKLPISEIQFGSELSDLLNEYDTLKQQYTESYPRLRALSEQIRGVANRIPSTFVSNIQRLNSQKRDLTQQKERVISDMQQYFVTTQRVSSQQSDFSIYEGLLNEMRVKLEQARMTRDIGQRAGDQFIVLDAANIPEKPASPNKRLVLGIGLFIGVVMGIAASAVAEVMDTTLRDERDIPYQKPIIAYLTSG
jgi:polysaccharide biosynthesis transport protein